jgi:serine/threonine protein kinase
VLEEAITDLHQMIKRQKRSLSLPAVRRWSRELLDGGNNSKVLDHACPIETVNISNFLFSRVCLVVLVACVPVLFDKYSVQYLHSIKVIHRDLKPSNLLIFKDMTLKLGDFGLAREAAPTEMLPVRREICTLWYRAPELIMGDESYCSKIDVWSAGCIMLEMLVGRCATAGRVEDVCKVHVPQTVPPTRTPQSLTHRSTPSLINTKC